jgi:two-component system sensor histidine kinase AlgZ
MAQAKSIRENAAFTGLPDFRNLGVWLRLLLAVNALALLAALLRNRDIGELPREFAELAALVEPVAIASVLLLAACQRLLLSRLPFWPGVALIEAVVAALTTAFLILFGLSAEIGLLRSVWWALLAAAAILGWLVLRARAQTPALAEARLMALTARIRPHFLFNSLNAVLGIIRSDPHRAEVALEELSDLFRVLMRDNRDLVPLSEEIALARQYLALEHLRLGDRLVVQWEIESCPPDALVPPLLLQPLLENAVYYGIEPAENPGRVLLKLAHRKDRIVIELTNPYDAGHAHTPGNQMALINIRERLLLFFDIEASLTSRQINGQYIVRIELPYRRDRGTAK